MSRNIPKDAYAIIIGAMKGGTSSLYSYLKNHPEICPAKIKEPEFFSSKQAHGIDSNDYTGLWDYDPSRHKYVIEASTGYTKFPSEPDIPKRMNEYGIHPRLIYIIRNPFDRIVSHYNFMQKNDAWTLSITDSHLINTSNYYLQLEQYRKYFSVKNILILDFQDLKETPVELLKKTYRFLGISDSYFPDNFEARNVTVVESGFEKKLKQHKIGRILNYVPKPLKEIGKKILRPGKRTLSDQERAYIYDELKDDMALLHRVYGIDVKKWGF